VCPLSVIASPVRDGHDLESGRSATAKKENLTAKPIKFSAWPKPTTHHDCLIIEGDIITDLQRVHLTAARKVAGYEYHLHKTYSKGSRGHYAQLMWCIYHVNGPYGSVTRLHKHEYELTKHSVRKHQMACNIQTTMLLRPENSLERLLATEEYSCTRYPFSTFRRMGKRIHLHRKMWKNRELWKHLNC
jgi:hypothetical protein